MVSSNAYKTQNPDIRTNLQLNPVSIYTKFWTVSSFIIYTQQKRKNKAILDFKILPSIHDFLLLVILIKYKQYCYN